MKQSNPRNKATATSSLKSPAKGHSRTNHTSQGSQKDIQSILIRSSTVGQDNPDGKKSALSGGYQQNKLQMP
jgi:hypothetical protein